MSIAVMKQALEALYNSVDLAQYEYDHAVEMYGQYPTRAAKINGLRELLEAHKNSITNLSQAIEQAERVEPVACDGDFPEGFDNSFGIPAQALRQANAALCEVTNNRMWDVPALAQRMMVFCSYTTPPTAPAQQIIGLQAVHDAITEDHSLCDPDHVAEVDRSAPGHIAWIGLPKLKDGTKLYAAPVQQPKENTK